MRHATAARRAFTVAITALGLTQCVVADEGAGSAGGEQGRDSSLLSKGDQAPYPRPDAETTGAAVAVLIDNSGSMAARAPGDQRRKYLVARSAIAAVLGATREHVRDNPDYPVKVGIYRFADEVEAVLPIAPYDSAAVQRALQAFPPPDGNTAIGDAMEAARRDLYGAGLIRKYILVVTDGENTAGRPADKVVAEIARRSEQSVRIYYIAFDVDAESFAFVREAGGDVLSARGGPQLREALAEVYRGRILAEAEEYGDAFPQPAGGAAGDQNTQRSAQP